MVVVAIGSGGSSPVEPSLSKPKPPAPSTSSSSRHATGGKDSSTKASSPIAATSTRQATEGALKTWKSGNATDENQLETVLWNQAVADAKEPQTLLDSSMQLNEAWTTIEHADRLPSNVTPAELRAAFTAAALKGAEQQLPQQTSQAIAAVVRAAKQGPALSRLETATFNEEVLNYEKMQPHPRYEVPWSAPWRTDAQAMLANPAALQAVRATLAAAHKQQLGTKGVDEPHFEAALWAGETVAGAKLAQRQGGYAQAVGTLAAALSDPNADAANSGINLGLDPKLARQVLRANSYVIGLPLAINRRMRESGSTGGIPFLAGIVSSAAADPQLATTIVRASTSTLRSDLNTQSSVNLDQAAGTYVALATIYFVMKQAGQTGDAPDAAKLADQLAQWSYAALNATNDTPEINDHTGGVIGPGPRDLVLQAIVSQAQQQHVAGNLFQAWLQQARSPGGPLAQPANDADPGWSTFVQSIRGDRQLASRPLNSTPLRAAPQPQELTQDLQAKLSAGQSLSEAITATRAQMAVEYSDPRGDRNEMLLAEAALAMTGANYLNTYYDHPTVANDPIARASRQIAQLGVFNPTILRRATQTMTAMGTPNTAALQQDAGAANAALETWQADLSADKPASVLGRDEQSYHAALLAELNDATGQTGSAWLNNPVAVDQLWKAEGKVMATNLASLNDIGDQQARETAADSLQTSFAAIGILTDVSAAQHASGNAVAVQQLTASLSGFAPTNPLYQEVMGDGSVQTLEGAALKDILHAGAKTPKGTPESRLANESKVLSEYQGTVLYAALLSTTEKAPITQELFDAVAHGPMTDRESMGDKLTEVAGALNGLQADSDLAAALYQAKFAKAVPSWIADYYSQDDQQTYYSTLGEIYVDIGGAQSAQGAVLRNAMDARMTGDDPVATPTMSGEGGRAGALDPSAEHVVLTYDFGDVKAAGQPMQLYQDIIDESPHSAGANEIEMATGFAPTDGTPPEPINAAGTDPVGLAGVDGLAALTTKAELINELGQYEGLTKVRLPQSPADQTALTDGQYVEYSLDQRVYGNTTLGDIVNSVLSASQVREISARAPVVLSTLPLIFRKQESQTLGQPQTMSLLEIDGRSGQIRYVGPANVTAQNSYANWQEYNGFAKGLMLVQPGLVVGSDGQALQGNAYWISNQTGITTWDKVRSDLEIVGSLATMALAIFLPETAPLWLMLLADGADAYFTATSAQALMTSQGRSDWVNWVQLGASLLGGAAAAGGMFSRAARITERLGVEVDGFQAAEDAGESVRTSQQAPEEALAVYKDKKSYQEALEAYNKDTAARAALEKATDKLTRAFGKAMRSGADIDDVNSLLDGDLVANAELAEQYPKLAKVINKIAKLNEEYKFDELQDSAPRPVLTFKPTRLQSALQSAVARSPSSLRDAVQLTDRVTGSGAFRLIGGGAMITNGLDMTVQGVEMWNSHSATLGDWLQLISNAALMGLGEAAERGDFAPAGTPNSEGMKIAETTPSDIDGLGSSADSEASDAVPPAEPISTMAAGSVLAHSSGPGGSEADGASQNPSSNIRPPSEGSGVTPMPVGASGSDLPGLTPPAEVTATPAADTSAVPARLVIDGGTSADGPPIPPIALASGGNGEDIALAISPPATISPDDPSAGSKLPTEAETVASTLALAGTDAPAPTGAGVDGTQDISLLHGQPNAVFDGIVSMPGQASGSQTTATAADPNTGAPDAEPDSSTTVNLAQGNGQTPVSFAAARPAAASLPEVLTGVEADIGAPVGEESMPTQWQRGGNASRASAIAGESALSEVSIVSGSLGEDATSSAAWTWSQTRVGQSSAPVPGSMRAGLDDTDTVGTLSADDSDQPVGEVVEDSANGGSQGAGEEEDEAPGPSQSSVVDPGQTNSEAQGAGGPGEATGAVAAEKTGQPAVSSALALAQQPIDDARGGSTLDQGQSDGNSQRSDGDLSVIAALTGADSRWSAGDTSTLSGELRPTPDESQLQSTAGPGLERAAFTPEPRLSERLASEEDGRQPASPLVVERRLNGRANDGGEGADGDGEDRASSGADEAQNPKPAKTRAMRRRLRSIDDSDRADGRRPPGRRKGTRPGRFGPTRDPDRSLQPVKYYGGIPADPDDIVNAGRKLAKWLSAALRRRVGEASLAGNENDPWLRSDANVQRRLKRVFKALDRSGRYYGGLPDPVDMIRGAISEMRSSVAPDKGPRSGGPQGGEAVGTVRPSNGREFSRDPTARTRRNDGKTFLRQRARELLEAGYVGPISSARNRVETLIWNRTQEIAQDESRQAVRGQDAEANARQAREGILATPFLVWRTGLRQNPDLRDDPQQDETADWRQATREVSKLIADRVSELRNDPSQRDDPNQTDDAHWRQAESEVTLAAFDPGSIPNPTASETLTRLIWNHTQITSQADATPGQPPDAYRRQAEGAILGIPIQERVAELRRQAPQQDESANWRQATNEITERIADRVLALRSNRSLREEPDQDDTANWRQAQSEVTLDSIARIIAARSSFAHPDDIKVAAFWKALEGSGLPDALIAAIAPREPTDPVTGFLNGRLGEGHKWGQMDAAYLWDETMLRAAYHVRQTPDESAFLVTGEIANLKGLNHAQRNVTALADAVYRDMAWIVRDELMALDASVVPMRRTATEIGFLIVGNVSYDDVSFTLEAAHHLLKEYTHSHQAADSTSLDEIRHPETAEPGVDMLLAVSQIRRVGPELEQQLARAAREERDLEDFQAKLADRLRAGEQIAQSQSPPDPSPGIHFSDPTMYEADFVRNMARQHGVSEDQIESFISKPHIDPVTSFPDAREVRGYGAYRVDILRQTIRRAWRYASEKNVRAFYVAGDFANLGGLNAAARTDLAGRAEANAHYGAVTDIVNRNLVDTGAVVVPMRTGGDEFGFVVVGSLDEDELRGALDTSKLVVEQYANSKFVSNSLGQEIYLSDIANPKHPEQPGIGVHLGIAEIPGADEELAERGVTQVLINAELGIDRSKSLWSRRQSEGSSQVITESEQTPDTDGRRPTPASDGEAIPAQNVYREVHLEELRQRLKRGEIGPNDRVRIYAVDQWTRELDASAYTGWIVELDRKTGSLNVTVEDGSLNHAQGMELLVRLAKQNRRNLFFVVSDHDGRASTTMAPTESAFRDFLPLSEREFEMKCYGLMEQLDEIQSATSVERQNVDRIRSQAQYVRQFVDAWHAERRGQAQAYPQDGGEIPDNLRTELEETRRLANQRVRLEEARRTRRTWREENGRREERAAARARLNMLHERAGTLMMFTGLSSHESSDGALPGATSESSGKSELTESGRAPGRTRSLTDRYDESRGEMRGELPENPLTKPGVHADKRMLPEKIRPDNRGGRSVDNAVDRLIRGGRNPLLTAVKERLRFLYVRSASGEYAERPFETENFNPTPGGPIRYLVETGRRMLRFADVHFHRIPYDRREKLGIRNFLRMVAEGIEIAQGESEDLAWRWDDRIRVALNVIAQGSGRNAHYTGRDAQRLDYKNAWRLDRRSATEYLEQCTPAQQAQADLMINGENPIGSKPTRGKPTTTFKEYVKYVLLKYPGAFKGIGELTLFKEYVTGSLPDNQRVEDLDDERLKDIFDVAQETGLVLLIHCDWGHAPRGTDHTLLPGATDYAHFEKLIKLAAEYPGARIILAHTGLGRYVKANTINVPVEFRGETKEVPRHIALLYHAVKRAPNIHFDISWTDVAEAYTFDPEMGDALTDFILENPERVLLGTDSVKPVNLAQYLQNITAWQPLLDELDRIDPSGRTAWLLERGNYERLFNGAETDVENWTRRKLLDQALDGESGALDKLAKMDSMLAKVRAERRRLLEEITPEFARRSTPVFGPEVSGGARSEASLPLGGGGSGAPEELTPDYNGAYLAEKVLRDYEASRLTGEDRLDRLRVDRRIDPELEDPRHLDPDTRDPNHQIRAELEARGWAQQNRQTREELDRELGTLLNIKETPHRYVPEYVWSALETVLEESRTANSPTGKDLTRLMRRLMDSEGPGSVDQALKFRMDEAPTEQERNDIEWLMRLHERQTLPLLQSVLRDKILRRRLGDKEVFQLVKGDSDSRQIAKRLKAFYEEYGPLQDRHWKLLDELDELGTLENLMNETRASMTRAEATQDQETRETLVAEIAQRRDDINKLMELRRKGLLRLHQRVLRKQTSRAFDRLVKSASTEEARQEIRNFSEFYRYPGRSSRVATHRAFLEDLDSEEITFDHWKRAAIDKNDAGLAEDIDALTEVYRRGMEALKDTPETKRLLNVAGGRSRMTPPTWDTRSELSTTYRDRGEEVSRKINREIAARAVAGSMVAIVAAHLAAHPDVDSLLFIGRGALNQMRTLKIEFDRYFDELITEEGGGGRKEEGESDDDYRERLRARINLQCDHWIKKLQDLGGDYDILRYRVQQAIDATQQLRADLLYIHTTRLGEDQISYDRLTVQSLAACYWKQRMDAAMGIQSASPSMTALSVRTRLGQLLRASIALTFFGNGGINVADLIYTIRTGQLISVAGGEHFAFVIGNFLLAMQALTGLSSGRWGANWEELRRTVRNFQFVGSGSFSVGSVFLAIADTMNSIASGIGHPVAMGLNALKAGSDAMIAYGTGRTAEYLLKTERRLGQAAPGKLARFTTLAAIGLAVRGILGFFNSSPSPSPTVSPSPSPTVSPSPSPTVSPSPSPTVSPSPSPTVSPSPSPTVSPSPSPTVSPSPSPTVSPSPSPTVSPSPSPTVSPSPSPSVSPSPSPTVSPSPSPTVSPSPSPTPSPSPSPTSPSPPKKQTKRPRYLVKTPSGLNLRSQPSLGASRRGVFEEGALVYRIDTQEISRDHETWIHVAGVDSNGRLEYGWVAEKFLAPYQTKYRRTVVVQPGDTMWGIAVQHDVSLSELTKVNRDHIPDPDLLVPGAVIYLPSSLAAE
jgi:hypothetical protein